jgi:hypothetical protein
MCGAEQTPHDVCLVSQARIGKARRDTGESVAPGQIRNPLKGHTMGVAVEEDVILFPELDTRKPEHKRLLKLAKTLAKERADRAALLGVSKEKVDAAEGKVIAQMHECGLKKFRYDGVTTEIIDGKEKCTVAIEDEDEEAADDPDE